MTYTAACRACARVFGHDKLHRGVCVGCRAAAGRMAAAAEAAAQRKVSRGVDWDVELPRAVAADECVSDLARRLGVSCASVSQAAIRRKIKLPAHPQAARGIKWREEFRRADDAGEGTIAIARRLGVSAEAVRQARAAVAGRPWVRPDRQAKAAARAAAKAAAEAAAPPPVVAAPAPPVVAAPDLVSPQCAGPAWRAFVEAQACGVWPDGFAVPRSEAEARMGLEAAVIAKRAAARRAA